MDHLVQLILDINTMYGIFVTKYETLSKLVKNSKAVYNAGNSYAMDLNNDESMEVPCPDEEYEINCDITDQLGQAQNNIT